MSDDFNQIHVEQAPVTKESQELSRQVNDLSRLGDATVSAETLNNPSQWLLGPRQETYDLPAAAERLRRRFQS